MVIVHIIFVLISFVGLLLSISLLLLECSDIVFDKFFRKTRNRVGNNVRLTISSETDTVDDLEESTVNVIVDRTVNDLAERILQRYFSQHLKKKGPIGNWQKDGF